MLFRVHILLLVAFLSLRHVLDTADAKQHSTKAGLPELLRGLEGSSQGFC